jgi:prepilin-type N-terminal cleavage/methylation domain-containing protein
VGFTLFEVVVVLVVIALVATLVAPSIGALPERGDAGVVGLAAQARLAAVRRAESLELRLDSTGAWVLSSTRYHSTIASGQVDGDSVAPLTLRISALGVCTTADPSRSAGPTWDALRCAPSRSGPPAEGGGPR